MKLKLTDEQLLGVLKDQRKTFLWVDDLFGEVGGYVKVDPDALARLILGEQRGYTFAYVGTFDSEALWLDPRDEA